MSAFGKCYGRPEPLTFKFRLYANGKPIGEAEDVTKRPSTHVAVDGEGKLTVGVDFGSAPSESKVFHYIQRNGTYELVDYELDRPEPPCERCGKMLHPLRDKPCHTYCSSCGWPGLLQKADFCRHPRLRVKYDGKTVECLTPGCKAKFTNAWPINAYALPALSNQVLLRASDDPLLMSMADGVKLHFSGEGSNDDLFFAISEQVAMNVPVMDHIMHVLSLRLANPEEVEMPSDGWGWKQVEAVKSEQQAREHRPVDRLYMLRELSGTKTWEHAAGYGDATLKPSLDGSRMELELRNVLPDKELYDWVALPSSGAQDLRVGVMECRGCLPLQWKFSTKKNAFESLTLYVRESSCFEPDGDAWTIHDTKPPSIRQVLDPNSAITAQMFKEWYDDSWIAYSI